LSAAAELVVISHHYHHRHNHSLMTAMMVVISRHVYAIGLSVKIRQCTHVFIGETVVGLHCRPTGVKNACSQVEHRPL